MKSESGISYDNAAVASCPKHLLQFAVDQRYDDYTSVDHAVWRFIMRQNIFFLKEYAHKVYFQGLLNTGISFDRIPRIQEMNDILAKIGWGAVAVDGFIPPAAFMEFQAYKVLVIACDMRQIHHIEYTPAPDIVHEAAGHAPIIVDREYSEYLQRFGEVGAKAMSSKKDFELYQAIRHLSILKERPNADPKEVDEATKLVEHRQKTLGEPSEMALLSRLHWWTVEYGLIGPLENPKIYGAGLLSSIGESVSCLEPEVKKIPYSIDAMNTAFDITTRQPQLFVCRDFHHLKDVLEEFASKMAYQVGGLEGVNKAIECQNAATCEYSSGLQVSGVFTEVITDENNLPIYLRTTGKTALAFRDKELEGHGVDYHKDGFGSPVGKWKQTSASPESLTNDQLHALGVVEGRKAKIEFINGVIVSGKVEKRFASRRKITADHILKLQQPNTATVFCSIPIGARTTWPLASASVLSLTAPQTRTPTIKWRSFRRSGRSKSHPTRNESDWKTCMRRCAKFARARPATNGSAKFGKHNRPNIPKTGCCRWKFSKFSTRPINSES